jgi:surface polysaccharide O-acyltransferase-like enzyme
LFSVTLLIPDTSQILLGRKISLCLPFQGIGAYIGCFVIGYYLYNINKINKKGFKIAIQGFILINAITISMTYLLTIMSGNPNQTFLDRNCINSILSAMFIFYIIRYIFINFRINKNIIKAVAFIGKLSLIVYIIHPFIIILYSRFMKEKVNNLIDNFYFNFVLELLIVFIGSLIVSYITSILVKITQNIQKTIGSHL